ncbi:MAG TPA: class I SAM-dependent methyltransferase [Cyclobacteriaceae bacterium]|nr:class I SAM-dependent methyltransferase [Cyclobacteriaceae bacterium]
MSSKDLFSAHSALYKTFRPEYPQALYKFILQHIPDNCLAWDVGTGNGQVAKVLSKYFTSVYATDISEKQLAEAPEIENVCYAKCRAENSGLPDRSVDLITIAQALHWFNFESFNIEVKRVARPSALIAAWGYELLRINDELDKLIHDFYFNTIGAYWAPERKHIENAYRDIPFPYMKIECPKFSIEQDWTLAQLEGYLNTWSAVQHYMLQHQVNPVDELIARAEAFWPGSTPLRVELPIFLRMGTI